MFANWWSAIPFDHFNSTLKRIKINLGGCSWIAAKKSSPFVLLLLLLLFGIGIVEVFDSDDDGATGYIGRCYCI